MHIPTLHLLSAPRRPRARRGTVVLPALLLLVLLAAAPPARGDDQPEPAPTTDPADKPATETAEEAEEVVVTGTKTPKLVKETPVRTEVVSRKEIEQSGATNVVDALAHRTGVRVDNQCSICNATSIKLSGLPGRYTLLLIDGFPIYSSLGQTYGLMNIEAAQIEQIEIVKGASSVLYGTDAIGGVVNIITRKPGRNDFGTFQGQYGSYDSYRLSGAASVSRDKLSSLLTMSHTAHDRIDRDGNGISEYAGYVRTVGSGTLRWRPNARTDLLLRMAAAQETRQGGGLGTFVEVLDDDAVRRALTESVLTRRFEAGLKADLRLTPKLRGALLTAYTYHNQDSDYEGEVYNGRQHILNAQVELAGHPHPALELIGGVPYRLEYLDENLAVSEYAYHMAGAFVQADWQIADPLEAIAGFRYDHHNEYGSVYTPRLALKWGAAPWLTLRGGFGTGFRTPTTFYEYAHGVRPEGYELENNAHDPETSMSGNLSVTFDAGRWLNATIEGAWTRVQDPITVDLTDEGHVEAYNVDGTLQVISAETQLQSQPLKWLGLSAGYGCYRYRDEAGALTSAPPSHQITAAADLNFHRLGFKARLGADVFAPMDLAAVYGAGYDIRPEHDSLEGWLDEHHADPDRPRRAESPWYWLLNLRAQQRLARGMHLYAGIDNLLDFHQADDEGPLYFPADDSGNATPADVVYIWGPLRGRYIYAGLLVDF